MNIRPSSVSDHCTRLNVPDRLYYDQDGKDGEHAISPNDVRQGLIGNCYFLAALAAIAQSNPSYIQSIVKPLGNDTWAVKLYEKEWWSGWYKPVEIIVGRDDLLTTGALQMYIKPDNTRWVSDDKSGCRSMELWPSIIEAAFHKMKRGGGMDGGLPWSAFRTLTGYGGVVNSLPTSSPAEVKRRLERGEAVVVRTGPFDRWRSGPSRLPEQHAMMVKDVSQRADKHGKLEWIYTIYDQATGRDIQIGQAQLERETYGFMTLNIPPPRPSLPPPSSPRPIAR